MKVLLNAFLVFSLFCVLALGGAFAQDMQGEIVASGFNTPMGALVDDEGALWVIDSGMGGSDIMVETLETGTRQPITAGVGNSARIVKVHDDGSQEVVSTLPSILVGREATGGARLALSNGKLYATSGYWVEHAGLDAPSMMGSVIEIGGDSPTEIANIWDMEKADNPDGFVMESHPYGITTGPDGMLWVADAGANTLLKIDPESGETEVVVVFDGLPIPFPNPGRGGAMTTDAVPTAVVVDADGVAYVSLLMGFPFLPEMTKVVKVDVDGTVSDYATGLTSLTDLQLAPNGEMYAIQLAVFGEQGPTPATGALVHISEGNSEVILSELNFPTGLAFNEDGDAYLTIDALGPPGSGNVMMFAGLAAP